MIRLLESWYNSVNYEREKIGMKLQNVKGSIDYFPEEQKIRNHINQVLRDTFEEYGYLAIETPILMYYDILSGKYDENNDLLKEIYKLSDQGNRNLGLRYDLTVPFAKFIALNKNHLQFPFKRYEIAKVFRDGPVKLGRDREFTQCDADVVGLSGQFVEAECLSLYVTAFKKLNIAIKIQVNSRNLMVGLILESGISKELVSSTITIIDKMDKLSEEQFQGQLKDIGLTEKNIESLLKYFHLSLSELKAEFQATQNQELQVGLEELTKLFFYVKELGIEEYCIFTPTLARGQDYYTGNVFEVKEATGKITCSIGAGGRYDCMITNFIDDGKLYPAVGISFGLTSIYELLKMNNLKYNPSNFDFYMVPMGELAEPVTLKLANVLREKGVKVIVEMNKRKVKKCLEWADKNHIPYVTVIGDDEIQKNCLTIKNMFLKKNMECSLVDIDQILKILAPSSR